MNGSNNATKPKLALENNDASKFNTVPRKVNPELCRDELDDLIQVERVWKDHEKSYKTLPCNVAFSPTQVCLAEIKYNRRLF